MLFITYFEQIHAYFIEWFIPSNSFIEVSQQKICNFSEDHNFLSPCEWSEEGGSKFNWKTKSTYPVYGVKKFVCLFVCYHLVIFFNTKKSYPDLHHLQGVWNLPNKFHLYLIGYQVTLYSIFGQNRTVYTIHTSLTWRNAFMPPWVSSTSSSFQHRSWRNKICFASA